MWYKQFNLSFFHSTTLDTVRTGWKSFQWGGEGEDGAERCLSLPATMVPSLVVCSTVQEQLDTFHITCTETRQRTSGTKLEFQMKAFSLLKGNNQDGLCLRRHWLDSPYSEPSQVFPLEFTQRLDVWIIARTVTSMCGSWEYHNCLLHINVILSEALTLQQQQHEGRSAQSCQEYLSSLGTSCSNIILNIHKVVTGVDSY